MKLPISQFCLGFFIQCKTSYNAVHALTNCDSTFQVGLKGNGFIDKLSDEWYDIPLICLLTNCSFTTIDLRNGVMEINCFHHRNDYRIWIFSWEGREKRPQSPGEAAEKKKSTYLKVTIEFNKFFPLLRLPLLTFTLVNYFSWVLFLLN